MASISTNKTTGEKTLQFVLAGRRKSIWLGDMKKRDIDQWKGHVEELVAAKMQNNRAPYEATSKWVAGLDKSLHRKLVGKLLADGSYSVGLVPPRERVVPAPEKPKALLGPFLAGYIKNRSEVKASTTTVYEHTERCLVEFFGADKVLEDINSGDVKDWRRWLTQLTDKGGQGLAENTARRRCGIAKQFFADAVERELVGRNPFAKMKGTSVLMNRTRDYFVTREEAAAVLEACPDTQWRLLFALSRYGGLRCPSEHFALKWGDINWDRERITIRSPKTAHHGDGHEQRIMPLFPELKPYLEKAKAEFLEDFDPKVERFSEQPVITIACDTGKNFRTRLMRIIGRAGLKPWPKLFQNLRATRATELADMPGIPAHVAAEWLGHSNTIADKHYRQVTEDHFARALQGSEKTLHSFMLSDADSNGGGGLTPTTENQNSHDVDMLRVLLLQLVGDEGLEPPTFAV